MIDHVMSAVMALALQGIVVQLLGLFLVVLFVLHRETTQLVDVEVTDRCRPRRLHEVLILCGSRCTHSSLLLL